MRGLVLGQSCWSDYFWLTVWLVVNVGARDMMISLLVSQHNYGNSPNQDIPRVINNPTGLVTKLGVDWT